LLNNLPGRVNQLIYLWSLNEGARVTLDGCFVQRAGNEQRSAAALPLLLNFHGIACFASDLPGRAYWPRKQRELDVRSRTGKFVKSTCFFTDFILFLVMISMSAPPSAFRDTSCIFLYSSTPHDQALPTDQKHPIRSTNTPNDQLTPHKINTHPQPLFKIHEGV